MDFANTCDVVFRKAGPGYVVLSGRGPTARADQVRNTERWELVASVISCILS